MVTWQTQQMSQTYLLKNSKYSWKLLVGMHLGSMERMKDTTEAHTIWQDQDFLTVINTQTNGSVYQRHHQKYIDAKYTVNQTIPHLTLHL